MEELSPEFNNPTKRSSPLFEFLGIKTRMMKGAFFVAVGLIGICAFFSYLLITPRHFPEGEMIIIAEGLSLGEVSHLLKEKKVIRSRMLFEACILGTTGDRHVRAGTYLLTEPESVCRIADRIARGTTGLSAIRFTIPEGFTNREIAHTALRLLRNFDEQRFLEEAKMYEGFLFPDTYFLSPDASDVNVIETLSKEFDKKIEPFLERIERSAHSLREIVIMASILEKEAQTIEDQRMVSGILWKRIEINMPLQVDASFLYLWGKASHELTQEDLRFDSLYNTYVYRGLPPGPIGNPGLSAIEAALTPVSSPYLYYLHDSKGDIHYARTFDEHRQNKERHLR